MHTDIIQYRTAQGKPIPFLGEELHLYLVLERSNELGFALHTWRRQTLGSCYTTPEVTEK